MPGLLDGKTALVTGGGGGIGRATALAFAREGARLAVADYAAENAAETVARINAGGGQANTLTGGLTKTAALEYADDGIRVNAVCPGFIKTRMTEDTMRRRGEQIMAQIPFWRMGNPEEIAEMVVWLCSDRASYVSGACYNVDGGWM